MASYKSKLILHLNQGSEGSTMQSELIDYPGIIVTDTWTKKKKKQTRIISFEGKEFPTLVTAVEYWNANAKP